MRAEAIVSGDGSSTLPSVQQRLPILYLAPWVDFGGSDKGTIDWFRWLDRDRFAPSLITTQPSLNRRLGEVCPFAEEVWALPDWMPGKSFPRFIFDFIHTRGIRLVHIMNSRLGFDLLPDLRSLDRSPAVVVQLHVEEPDRSGYVRYVTTRYGNLVDAFSVSSRHLAEAVEQYEIPTSRIHVIPTGVDAEDEFNPERVDASDRERDQGVFQILYPGRLVEQKDPLLMVEVLSRLVARHHQVRMEVVGDGPLRDDVERRVHDLGLEGHIRFHPATPRLAGWLAISDLLLMTSRFEGVPYTLYEALAMKVPVVVPGLPGNVELLGDAGGRVIERRADPDAYVAAIVPLIEDDRLRARVGEQERARVLEECTVQDMCRRHEVVYERVLEAREKMLTTMETKDSGAPSTRGPTLTSPAPLRFTSRPTMGTPLVSIITPCYNHGRYLPPLLESFAAQDYPAMEVLLVDDGSTDRDTLELLKQVEQQGSARVLRQPRNRGPSAARNRAVSEARGRYILPVDADNVLLPGAVRSLVDQLQAAGERVGFIYPTTQYFGNRDYHFRPPAYNLYALLQSNFADTCSLLDRQIFDAGLRYAEDIELGHEDWDLALSLAERNVIGEPSRSTVMLYRKHGFTRSDLVEYLRLPFREEIHRRHPELFGGASLEIKARWNPALAVIAAKPVDLDSIGGHLLLQALRAQSCRDFEVILECQGMPKNAPPGLRRLPPGLAPSVAERIAEALSISRARYLLVSDSPAELLADPTVVERLLGSFVTDSELRAVVCADMGERAGVFPWAPIDSPNETFPVHAVAWRRELHSELPATIELQAGNELWSLAWMICGRADHIYWRHFPAHSVGTPGHRGPGHRVALERKRTRTSLADSERVEREAAMRVRPALPAMRAGQVPRWDSAPAWMPPETRLLARLVDENGWRPPYVGVEPPSGFRIDFQLGSIQQHSPPGTRRLIARNQHLLTVERGSSREDGDIEFGSLEEAPLPLFVGIERAVLHNGSETLVAASDRDPLRPEARELTFLGFIESFPNEPVHLPPYSQTASRPVLVRWIDIARRRHRYEAISPPFSLNASRLLGAELGRLHLAPDSASVAVYLDGAGYVCTDRYTFEKPSLAPKELARYAAAPLNWRGFASPPIRLRSSARRIADGQRIVAAGTRAFVAGGAGRRALQHASENRQLLGYLEPEPGPGLIELYAARHRVLPDQLLTHSPLEAYNMGYVDVRSLGYIGVGAPLTGMFGSQGVLVPWASRFGVLARVR